MERSTRYSTILLAVMLSPGMLQITECGGGNTGNTLLTALELEAGGENRVIGFVSSQRTYDVWVPEGIDTVILRATSFDPAASISLSYLGVTDPIGTGSGELNVDVPSGLSAMVVIINSPGGSVRSYVLDVTHGAAPPCFDCDDGNDCTNDICDPADGICTNDPAPELSSCDFGGTPGACLAGNCQSSQTKTIPVVCTNGVIRTRSLALRAHRRDDTDRRRRGTAAFHRTVRWYGNDPSLVPRYGTTSRLRRRSVCDHRGLGVDGIGALGCHGA